MGSTSILRRPAMLAVAILLVTAVFCRGALGNGSKASELPDSVHFRIGSALQRLLMAEPHKASRLQNHLQSFGKASAETGALDRRAERLFRNEIAGARWLSNITCKAVEPETSALFLTGDGPRLRLASFFGIYALNDYHTTSMRDSFMHSLREPGVEKFFACVQKYLQVELGWSDDTVGIFPTLLGLRLLWANAPALLSISHRSWSVLDAGELATLIHLRADPKMRKLPICVGFQPHCMADESGLASWPDATRVDEALLETAKAASGFGIEQLHVALHDYDSTFFVKTSEEMLRDTGLRRVLPNDIFSTFATSLLSAPFLRDVSISWDVRRSNSATVRTVKAMATALSQSTSVQKLAVMRTCSGEQRRVRSPDPLAAFTRIASAGGTWPAIETLSLTTHRCIDDPRPPSEYDLEALPTLVEQMPTLRRVHFEYRSLGGQYAELEIPDGLTLMYPAMALLPDLAQLQLPSVENILQRLPSLMTTTIAVDLIGIAGVASVKSLARLDETLCDGYAAVVYVLPVDGGVPTRQLELVGRNVLLQTEAMTFLIAESPSYGYPAVSRSGRNEWLDWFELRMPRLERLAIDSRWTRSYCNEFVESLPPQAGFKLRALLVHTIDLLDREDVGVFRALEGILRAGHGISVVDLGIEIFRDISDEHTNVIRSLAVTLSRMPLLKSLSLTLTSTCPIDDIRALADLVRGILPHARIITVSKESEEFCSNVDRRRNMTVAWWQFNSSTAVPPAPEFPSPKQFFEGL